MSDSAVAISIGDLAAQFGCEVRGDASTTVSRVATLSDATPDCVAFLANPLYASQLLSTAAGAVIVHPDAAEQSPVAAIIAKDPYLVYAQIATVLNPAVALQPGVHANAVVDATAVVPDSCEIAAGAVVEAGVVLGEGVYLGPNCFVGRETRIGSNTRLMANVSIYHGVKIGERCLFHSGAVIGADGFGIAKQPDTSWLKVPQVGGVSIGDDVEIGANSAVDRGAIEDTVLANGVKVDNLIQIAHNVVIGEHTALAGQSGVAGSTKIGARCLIGGRATINGHITICDDVAVTGAAGITHSIKKPGVYSGGIVPMDDAASHRKNSVRFKQLDKMARTLKKLERAVFDTGTLDDSGK